MRNTVRLRRGAPDWLPIIGKAPGWGNVYLGTGGAMKGILLSPAMGKAIADLVTTGRTFLSIAPFGLERFAAVFARGFRARRARLPPKFGVREPCSRLLPAKPRFAAPSPGSTAASPEGPKMACPANTIPAPDPIGALGRSSR